MVPSGVAPQGLHVTFPRDLAESVRAEAARRGLHPATLVAATMEMALGDNMLDAIFDDLDPMEIVGAYARCSDGMTYFECAALYLCAANTDETGFCRLSSFQMSRLIKGATETGVASTIQKLVTRGLVERIGRTIGAGLTLTRAGQAVARQLVQARED